VGRRLPATGSKVRGFNEQIFGADEPRTGGKATKKHSALHEAEPTMPMTVLICGSPASGFQIIGLFANSADAQSYAEDYHLKDWWVAEVTSPGAFAETSKSHL